MSFIDAVPPLAHATADPDEPLLLLLVLEAPELEVVPELPELEPPVEGSSGSLLVVEAHP